MDDLPKYKADPAFVKLGINKSPETFTRGSNQYSSGGSQGTSIVSSQPVFTLQPPIIERPQRRVEQGEVAEQSHPFKIFSSPIEDGYSVSLNIGTLNSILPNNIIDENSINTFTILEDTLYHVILRGYSDGTQFTSCELIIEESAPQTQIPALFSMPTEAEFLIGLVYNSNVFQAIFDNLILAGKQHLLKERDEIVNAGELLYEIYYIWA